MEITYRAPKNIMKDYDLPHLKSYRNNLDLKQTANAASKKGKKKRNTQNAQPSARDVRPVESVIPTDEGFADAQNNEVVGHDPHQANDSGLEVVEGVNDVPVSNHSADAVSFFV